MTHSTPPQPDDEQIIYDLEALKVYFDPQRARIMQALAGAPRTVHEVADILDVPFTRLYYQFNLLEKHGFIRVVQTRSLTGAVEEKYYQIAARLFTVDRALLTIGEEGEDDGLGVVMRAVLDDTADDVRRSVRAGLIDMHQRPPHPQSLLLKRAVFQLTPAAAQRLHQRMRQLVAEFTAESATGGDSDQTQGYALILGLYPSAFWQQNPDSEPEPDETT